MIRIRRESGAGHDLEQPRSSPVCQLTHTDGSDTAKLAVEESVRLAKVWAPLPDTQVQAISARPKPGCQGMH
ncbi:MAG: hypothetical protein ACRDPA_10145, partial [Solirubrobacteraceae bacterium]